MNYKIGGCDVSFPHQAYGTQLSFMGKVINAVDHGENALLEAPTGSGKTLSLLCSAVAWQQRERRRIEEDFILSAQLPSSVTEKRQLIDTRDDVLCDHQHSYDLPDHGNDEERSHHIVQQPVIYGEEAHVSCSTPGFGFPVKHGENNQCEDSPFKSNSKQTDCTTNSSPPSLKPKRCEETRGENTSTNEKINDFTPHGGFLADESSMPSHVPVQQRQTPPKIFYASRTHSQIAQVARELKRSGYCPRMAILASKSHYCVNEHARSQISLEEACEDLLRDRSCSYFNGVQYTVNSDAAWEVMDIEDLCSLGKTRKSCPYFVSQKWAQTAHIVFCPYNYLIDPVIRRSMQIDLEGAIVIFDEAHNIEDASREAATLDIDNFTIEAVQQALKNPLEYNTRSYPHMIDHYKLLHDLTEKIKCWLENKASIASKRTKGLQDDPYSSNRNYYYNRFDTYEYVFSEPKDDMMKELVTLGLGPADHEMLWEAYLAARAFDEEIASTVNSKQTASQSPSLGKGRPIKVGSRALGILSRIIQVVRMLHTCSENGKRDYRLAFSRVHTSAPKNINNRLNSPGKSRNLFNSENVSEVENFICTLSLWCLNPAVAFRQVAAHTRSVILTSGTLAPLESFASELGIPFTVRLEAPHVVNMQRQVWAGVIGSDPSGHPLQATYQYTNNPEFLDALGKTIFDLCRLIPDGVLIFFPSYSLLDRVSARWKVTGVWSKLKQIKKALVVEPRGGGSEALSDIMSEYYEGINSKKGGIFLAVCRGKVSEGLDFSDANARGVIIIGIPFPNVKDAKVIQKRGFNDAGSHDMGLSNGNVWYEQQAFRALNQAIGRCIRHRLDWGAIILVDGRFSYPKYQRGLSRWVRSSIRGTKNFHDASSSLTCFFNQLKNEDLSMKSDQINAVSSKKPDTKIDGIAMIMGGRRPLKRLKNEELNNENDPDNIAMGPSSSGKIPYLMEVATPPAATSIDVAAEEVRVYDSASLGAMPNQTQDLMPLFLQENPEGIDKSDILLSNAPVAQWVKRDMQNWAKWVREYSVRMQILSNPSELEVYEKAALGIEESFNFTRAELASDTCVGESIKKLPTEIGPPRGIQAVLSATGFAFEPKFHAALDREALLFGAQIPSGWNSIEILDSMQRKYRVELISQGFVDSMIFSKDNVCEAQENNPTKQKEIN